MNTVVEFAPGMTTREKVNALEAMMLALPKEEHVEMPLKHHFSQGVYAREIFIPKGTLVTGKIHKYQQLNIMPKGDLSVLLEDGIKRVQAPFVVVSPPGTKRIVYAHEDTVWITIHGTDETDLDKLEAHFTADSDADYERFVAQVQTKELPSCPGQ